MISENPLVSARIVLDLTQKELAAKAGLSTNTLVYLERGMYSRIPIRLLALLSDFPMIVPEYRAWRRAVREDTGSEAPFSLEPPFLEFYSHQYFREEILDMSINGYCAALCVERKIVFHYESGGQTRVPQNILEAIEDAYGRPFREHFYDQLTPEYLKRRG